MTALQGELLSLIRKERARRARRKKFGEVLTEVTAAVLVAALSALYYGWFFMLAVDAIHDHWLPQMPTLGYWWAVWIGWLVRVALALRSVPAKAKDGAS